MKLPKYDESKDKHVTLLGLVQTLPTKEAVKIANKLVDAEVFRTKGIIYNKILVSILGSGAGYGILKLFGFI